MDKPLKPRWLLAAVTILINGTFPATAAPTRTSASEAYGKLPLSFEANEGQVDEAVKFLSRGQGYTLFLTPAEAVLSLSGPQQATSVVRMQVAGGRRAPHVAGLDPQATRSNYFLGNDPSRWHTGVPHYARVLYEAVYPGVDLVYRGNRRQLEYDFIVAPGADPRRIRLIFRGAGPITLGAQGELVLHTKQGDLVQHPPVVYQELGEKRQPVQAHYVLTGRGTHRRVGFAVGRYDRSRPLIIDPVLVYSTFLGGGGDDSGLAIAADSAGNAYVTGSTTSTTFPGVNGGSIQPAAGGFSDAFVTKINPAGTAIVYSTFLGGSGTDSGRGIAIDAQGNAYITGFTGSSNFPGVTGSSLQPATDNSDAFVIKINPAGAAIVYSTFLGGIGFDAANAIAVDTSGNAYITGYTVSSTFPGADGSPIQPAHSVSLAPFDGFVSKINAAGTAIIYSTFLGYEGNDWGLAIAADADGNAYVTGTTGSPTFPGVNASSIQPVKSGAEDAFVTKINATGTAVVYSTFLGGGDSDHASGIAVDAAGNAYVTGKTASLTFPGAGGSPIQPANGGSADAFVSKINAAGTAIVYSTFLGGSGDDQGLGIAVDGAGNAYVAGETASSTFPGVGGSSIQPANGGGLDTFVTKINAAGTAIAYSTFLGGTGDDHAFGIAVDGAGNTYVTGQTASPAFTGANGGSIQPANGGGSSDAFVARISEGGLAFYTVTPCRMVDTRNATGPLGGPALQAGAVRTFQATGACGVPASARALSISLAVTQPAAAGYLSLFPGDRAAVPATSTINYATGQTLSNNASPALALDGSGSFKIFSSSSVHLILDVNGYFATEDLP